MIYVIFGPTCSQKSDISVTLSNFLNAPIINADAFQIYKDMNIGTAKVDIDSPEYKKHYLLDIITPDQNYSVKEYQDIFRRTLSDLQKKYKDIIVCGGTGLYIKAAFYDYTFLEEEDDPSLVEELNKLTNEELFSRLESLDLKACKKIHVNNRKRLIRALTIITKSTRTKSEIIDTQKHELIYPKEEVEFLFINPPREILYENINKRVDLMFDKGLVNEVINLLKKYNLSLTARQGIGYKEVISYLNNQISLEECKELIKKRTRNYAKRQVTFFKNQFKSRMFLSKNKLISEVISHD